jgi:DnaJ-domain-containing protein 1
MESPELIDDADRSGQDRAALLARRWRRSTKRNANRTTLAVARKLVAYLMAVDRGRCHFLVVDRETCAAA